VHWINLREEGVSSMERHNQWRTMSAMEKKEFAEATREERGR